MTVTPIYPLPCILSTSSIITGATKSEEWIPRVLITCVSFGAGHILCKSSGPSMNVGIYLCPNTLIQSSSMVKYCAYLLRERWLLQVATQPWVRSWATQVASRKSWEDYRGCKERQSGYGRLQLYQVSPGQDRPGQNLLVRCLYLGRPARRPEKYKTLKELLQRKGPPLWFRSSWVSDFTDVIVVKETNWLRPNGTLASFQIYISSQAIESTQLVCCVCSYTEQTNMYFVCDHLVMTTMVQMQLSLADLMKIYTRLYLLGSLKFLQEGSIVRKYIDRLRFRWNH